VKWDEENSKTLLKKRSITFEEVVETVKAFAHVDALRMTLRAQMRASAIGSLPISDKTVYIESGYIHYMLYRLLRFKGRPFVIK